MQRVIPHLGAAVLLLTAVTACASSSASSTSSNPGVPPSYQDLPAASLSQTPAAASTVPSGSGIACGVFTTQDFIQIYGTALASVTGGDGYNKAYGKSSSCTYNMSSPAGANVTIDLSCGYGAQLFGSEEQLDDESSLPGGPPGAVADLDGNGEPLASVLTASGVYFEIDDESVGPTPPGLNPVPFTKVTEAMNLAYANVQADNPCG